MSDAHAHGAFGEPPAGRPPAAVDAGGTAAELSCFVHAHACAGPARQAGIGM
ncbi:MULTISPECIES: hypothetical protein [Streptomyces]|uniref:hypothetical protein n=1 Tax=Streptomyces TaxID=1883 RepID=UPI0016871D37|nr:hypothetical protein [Streptomyces venezuelae]